jgi:hypothetical protein
LAKGIATEETRRIILSTIEKENLTIPDLFFCGDSLSKVEHCCFWHYIFHPNGGPERDGIYHPVYEYELKLLEALQDNPKKYAYKNKHIAVYKATGLGITEFMLLWIIWKCYTDEFFKDKEAIIITGPNVDLAQDLIRRGKRFLYDKGIQYVDHGAYQFEVNGGRIKCYPSNNIASARGKPKVSIFFGDESAFFKLKDDSIVRTVGERYIGKNDSYVVWVSTAGEEPAGFFYDIMLEGERETVYQRYHFYVEAGLKTDKKTKTSIFSHEFIKNAQEARSFAREYLGEWGKNVGDIFQTEALEEVCRNEYKISAEDDSFDRIAAVDPGYGSSEYGVVIMERSEGKYSVIFATSYERIGYLDAIAKVDKACKEFNVSKIFVDSSAPELVKDLRDTYHYNVNGIAFNEYGDRMLGFASNKVNKNEVRIHPMFKKLKQQLMTIKLNKKGLPDKTNWNSFDLGDAFLLALWYYKMGSGVIYAYYQ